MIPINDISTAAQQPNHKIRQKVESLKRRGYPVAEVDGMFSVGHAAIIARDYLYGPRALQNGKRPGLEHFIKETLRKELVPNSNQNPRTTKEQPKNNRPGPIRRTQENHRPQPTPKPKNNQKQTGETEVCQPENWHQLSAWSVWLLYRSLQPVQAFFKTREICLLFSFVLISVQSHQVAVAYMHQAANPEIWAAVVFGLFFELTGLVLTVQSANRDYLIIFGIISSVVNLCHHRILEPFAEKGFSEQDAYQFILRLVFSVGLPYAIYSFNELYAGFRELTVKGLGLQVKAYIADSRTSQSRLAKLLNWPLERVQAMIHHDRLKNSSDLAKIIQVTGFNNKSEI